jgi:isoleucyl-tRNA synthetase
MSNNNQQQNNKGNFAQMEERILDFWDKNNTFQKSIEKPASAEPKGDYVFYDGPPFGTGEPHYGHILSSIAKDVVPRFWTMKGYRVERRWGWDCHGLPIENVIEEDLGINGKNEIEKMGVDKFNEACRARVTEYADIWDVMIRRIARWVDFQNSYKTMDADFMESVWWGFKQLWEKELVYEGRKVLLYCPRCETPISNFEVAMDNSYRDITETSVYVKFQVTDTEKISPGLKGENVSVLAWTTTPWTLPGNVALAVGEDIDYVVAKIKDEYVVLAEDKREEVLEGVDHEIYTKLKGKDLAGLTYKPLFKVPAVDASGKKAYYVATADFVTTDEGTGIVHTAVVYGEDDYELGLKLDLPVVPSLDDKGYFNSNVTELEGVYFKKADEKIINKLKERGDLFKEQEHTHSYPHCHRCDTQLFYNAIPAWFLDIDTIRSRMLELNESINWYPSHLKHGRFAQGIEQAPDWNISRNRFFATPIPVWRCDGCRREEVVGTVQELKEKSGAEEISDLHNHFIDHLTWSCPDCGGRMKRIEEVFDCWVESGSMPFAQNHYLGEPLDNFDPYRNVRFPAQFISEYISQTRAWFYVMHVMSTALFDSHCFENAVTTGVILNDKGEKMSKSKKNYPDPWRVLNEYGADPLRMYLMSSSVMKAENLFFNEDELKDVFRKNVMLTWNVYKFYQMFAPENTAESSEPASDNILDKWLIVLFNKFVQDMTEYMENYDLPRAARSIGGFVNDLSTWYLRRSRERFKGENEDEQDKDSAIQVTGYVLRELSKVIAPFMPFLAEQIWQGVTGNNYQNEASVHLEKWPEKSGGFDEKILNNMEAVRSIVEIGLAKRDEIGIKIRQPLAKLTVYNENIALDEQYLKLIKDEVNVKKVELNKGDGEKTAELDTELTPELLREGMKREVIRYVNALRKKEGLSIEDRVAVYWQSDSEEVKKTMEEYRGDILKSVLADNIYNDDPEKGGINKEVSLGEEVIKLGIKKE